MSREDLVEKVDEVAAAYGCRSDNDMAEDILDAILPQVTTVAELEGLNRQAQVLDRLGFVGRAGSVMARETVEHGGSLTVVWQPS